MKQALQNLKTGEVTVEEIPAPLVRPGGVLVRNHYSLISSGTEGGTVKLGQMSLLGKARARPEQVRKVFELAHSDGWIAAYNAAQRSLAMPMVLGYCCAGEVIEVGEAVTDLRRGDRVACGGGGHAVHAEIVAVPRNLCVRVPPEVDLRRAAFTTLGSIAMQSVRIADVRLGENVVVIGLGLVGLLAVQLLRAAGCKVFGIDTDPRRVEFAAALDLCTAVPRSAGNLLALAKDLSGGYGADAVIITAAAPTNDPVALAGDLARYRGRVVVVGRTEMTAPRETYLFKELQLCTSLAYGPGTGDPIYEEQGVDYPIGYVRWTENRNMEGFLQLAAEGRLQVERLVTHEFDIGDAARAFAVVTGGTGEPSVAVLLRYPHSATAAAPERVALRAAAPAAGRAKVRVGVIGSGSFATNFMVPILARVPSVDLRAIASATGVRGHALGKKYGFGYCVADAAQVLDDPEIDCVFILTRHDSHAPLTIAALQRGKDVFVEKPLALNRDELRAVYGAWRGSGRRVLVGFNRRFAPLAVQLKQFFQPRSGPLGMLYRMNAGAVPREHWLHDPQQGGGRIVGEGCHFFDFLQFLTDSEPVEVSARALGAVGPQVLPDNMQITVAFADGSVGTIAYLSGGDRRFSRERVEVYGNGGVGVLQDFRDLTCMRNGRRQRKRAWLNPDKGHRAEVETFLAALLSGEASPVPFEQHLLTMQATFEALDSARQGQPRVVTVFDAAQEHRP